MNNPPGLVRIVTGGSANTTAIDIDGTSVMAKRCTIVIDPALGENQIRLQCFSRQKNKHYDDGTWQVFCGISNQNFEFFRGLMKIISTIDDQLLAPPYIDDHPPHVYELLSYIAKARSNG